MPADVDCAGQDLMHFLDPPVATVPGPNALPVQIVAIALTPIGPEPS